MSLHEIVLARTEPATEWVRGRALQKARPSKLHAAVHGRLAMALIGWAARTLSGRVAVEWRFRVAPPGEVVRPLVPDIAYLAYDALGPDAPDDDIAAPLGGPTVAVDVLAPEDLRADVDDKIATYLRAGTAAVIIVDPAAERVVVHDAAGARTVERDGQLGHEALPGFSASVASLLAQASRQAGGLKPPLT